MAVGGFERRRLPLRCRVRPARGSAINTMCVWVEHCLCHDLPRMLTHRKSWPPGEGITSCSSDKKGQEGGWEVCDGSSLGPTLSSDPAKGGTAEFLEIPGQRLSPPPPSPPHPWQGLTGQQGLPDAQEADAELLPEAPGVCEQQDRGP